MAKEFVAQFGDNLPVVLDPEHAVRNHLANLRRIQAPFLEDSVDLVLPAAPRDQKHALLGLGEHDLVWRHAVLALRHGVQLDFDAYAPTVPHLGGRTRQSGRAHVLNAEDGVGLHGLQARFQQQLLEERVADLHVGALGLGVLVKLGRRHGRALNTVPAGLGSYVDDRIADAARRSQKNRVLAEDAEGERIDERVRAEARVERSLAADRGHAEAVAVMRDTLHDAAHDAAIRRAMLRIVRRSEPQRVHAGDRPCSHREDVAQDSPDAGGGTLERLDVAGMVVRLDLERRGPAAANIDDAGVLAGTDQNALAPRREFLQEQARTLVGAVLAPHHADDAEFGYRGRPSQPV